MNPNQFTETTTVGFGSRIMSAIIGVPIGLLLIFGSSIMLYWNEGRTDYSKVAAESVPVQADRVDQSANGTFVSVTGGVTGQELDDGTYLKPTSAVAVQRVVEEYAWVEESHTDSHDNTGGSQANTTTYTYKQEWVSNPSDSANFKHPEGHQNLPKSLNDTSVRATSAKIGAYSFDPQTIKLPKLSDVTLNAESVTIPAATPVTPATAQSAPVTQTTTAAAPTAAPAVPNVTLASPQYLFGGKGSLGAPQLGDIRVSYKSLPSGTNVTAFGKLTNGTLAAYTDSKNHTLYSLLRGDRQTAIATLHSEYQKTTWILRGVGIALIWFGLMLLFGPLNTLLSFLPIAGQIGGMFSLIITFPVALLLGGTVILVGYTMHHILALLIAIPLVIGIVVGILKLVRHKRGIPKNGAAAPAAPQQPVIPAAPAAPAGGVPQPPVSPGVPQPPAAVPQPLPPVAPAPPSPQVISPNQPAQTPPAPQEGNQQPPTVG